MHEQSTNNYDHVRAVGGLAGSYAKLILAVAVGAVLGLGIYFFLLGNTKLTDPVGGGVQPGQQTCTCPSCGTTVPRPAQLDCEELACPNCGQLMGKGIQTIAAQMPQFAATPMPQNTAPMTQNRRETLAEQGIIAPGPIGQNQRETLLEQGINLPRTPNRVAFLPQHPNNLEAKCVCPNCGNLIDAQPGLSCEQTGCPACGSAMTNPIFIGAKKDVQLVAGQNVPAPVMGNPNIYQQPAPSPYLGGAGGGQFPGQAPVTAPCINGGACPPQQVAVTAPCINGGACPPQQVAVTAPCPQAMGVPPCPHVHAAAQPITYTNSIQPIIAKNCLRCHGGPIRTLNTYAQVKSYADNGLLVMMTQPGGPMSRFLSAEESHQIDAWVKGGAPQ